MTRKILAITSLSAIACLTIAMPAAHAGGGMGTGGNITTCRIITSGAHNQPQSIAVVDAFSTNELPNGPGGDVVKINVPVLVCGLTASGVTVSGPATGTPVPGALDPDSITCYAVSGGNPAKTNVSIQDPFTEAANSLSPTQNMVIGAIQLVCVPSVTTPLP